MILALAVLLFSADTLKAGNPDRQGEAGAYQLIMNPWARSAGLHTINTARASGIDAMRINPAGLSGVTKTDLVIGRSNYLQTSGVFMNAVGFGQRIGENGVLGISLMALDFGEIDITTTEQPEGIGSTYSPLLFNIGVGYSYTFSNKISCGAVIRLLTEGTTDATASGVALDAGVQYVTGEKDNFKLGIALRNIGPPMRYKGEALALVIASPEGGYNITLSERAEKFELPSLLNLGISYDIWGGERNRFTLIGNFTAHSFSRDQYGAGLEYSFREMFTLRGAFRYEPGLFGNITEKPVYTGGSAGCSILVPLKKKSDKKIGLDYAYRTSNPFRGTHNLGLRFNL